MGDPIKRGPPGYSPDREACTPRQRLFSGLEVCVAVFIVVAHNVYHWIPNEVPLLLVLAIASFRMREGHWGTPLFSRPKSWPRTFLAAGSCVLLLELKDLLLEPIGRHFWPEPQRVSSVISHSHDLRHALFNIAFVWVFAAFGEEVGYRGYLLRRAIEVCGPTRFGAAAALLVASLSFGLGHYYKGPAGVLESTGSGLILGCAYLVTRRLWVSSLAHGLNDTIAVLFSYFGW